VKVPELSVHQPDKLPRETTVDRADKANKSSAKPVTVADSGIKADPPRASAQAQLSALFKTLGLPADRLSHSLISFAKFFSLPLEPRMLAKARAASLVQPDTRAEARPLAGQAGPSAQASTGAIPNSRQALALAVLAAADKGLSLSPTALEEYAAAIDPDQQNEHGGQPDGGGDERGNASRDSSSEQRDERRTGLPADPALRLKEQFCETAECCPALDVLNRLPSRNGHRWLVFPLSFTENGVQFRVSLRFLLDGYSCVADALRRMSLDIAQCDTKSGAEQRWLFMLDREKFAPGVSAAGQSPDSEGGSAVQSRLTVLLRPCRSRGKMKALGRKLSRVLDIPVERIEIRNYRDADFAVDCREDEVGGVGDLSL